MDGVPQAPYYRILAVEVDETGLNGPANWRIDMPRAGITALLGIILVLWPVVVVAQPNAGEESPAEWSAAEAKILSNIRQVTRVEMGLDKAGEAYFDPTGSRIIFQAFPKGETAYQIYAMPLGGGEPKMVSTGRGECTCGYFHPNGRRVVFASTHLDPDLENPENATLKQGYQRESGDYVWRFHPAMDLFEADADGSNLRRLTTEPGYDAEGAYDWKGERIAFASNRTGDMEVYVMNADGSGVRRITNRAGYDGGPFLSPDGKKIIYRGDPEGNSLLQIFSHDLASGKDTRLTDNGAVNWAPYWHPNGRVIVYTSSVHGHRNYELYLMAVKTGKSVRVTHWPGNERTNGFDGLGVFSRDGSKLMWTSKRGPQATSQIWVADFAMPAELAGG